MDKGNFKQTILETERLLLKELNPEILYNLFTFYSDEEIMEFLGMSSDTELEMERLKFDGGYITFKTTFKRFQVVDKVSGKVIGHSGFHTWYIHHFRAEMGYAIDEQYQNKGLMTEANRAVVKYGFEQMGLNRIEAFTSPRNFPSIRILKSLGFKEEGVLREHYFKNNRLEDSACFGLLRRDYRS